MITDRHSSNVSLMDVIEELHARSDAFGKTAIGQSLAAIAVWHWVQADQTLRYRFAWETPDQTRKESQPPRELSIPAGRKYRPLIRFSVLHLTVEGTHCFAPEPGVGDGLEEAARTSMSWMHNRRGERRDTGLTPIPSRTDCSTPIG